MTFAAVMGRIVDMFDDCDRDGDDVGEIVAVEVVEVVVDVGFVTLV